MMLLCVRMLGYMRQPGLPTKAMYQARQRYPGMPTWRGMRRYWKTHMATLCAIAREQAHASFDAVGAGYYRQAYAAQSYCAAYVVAQKFGLDTSGFKFDKVCQSCAGKDAQELRAFLSDVKRAAYSINREVQRGFREMEQAIQPDEFSVDKGKASKAAKTEKQPESR